uniref:Uncharacterized protein n=1 Tax=Nannospalax galili TaxID=1026970 RepID=A0A8C6QKK2_NANGA
MPHTKTFTWDYFRGQRKKFRGTHMQKSAYNMFIKGKERGLFICLSHFDCWHGDYGYEKLYNQTGSGEKNKCWCSEMTYPTLSSVTTSDK